MEPRPQRPRSASPQQRTGQMPAHQQSPEGQYDEHDQPYIAPPRTEYDYSPLDLAPSGQRRKRQFVAGAIGVLMIVLVGAVAVLAFLLINNGDSDDGPDLAARETQTASTVAAVNAQQTENADASINATGTAASTAGATETSGEAGATDPATGEATEAAAGDATEPAGEPTDEAAASEATGADSEDAEATTGEASSSAGPDVSQLEAMLPPADAIPAGLDNEAQTNLDQAAVVTALGDSRTAQQNLERWGWSGNVGRSWTPTDPAALESDTVSGLFVSIHGFNSPESSTEALAFFADVLASGEGQTEGEPPMLGDGSRLLTSTAEDGTVTVALYVVQGNVLYRFGATGADPQADLIALAETTLAGGSGE